jgi:hypothetical protein
MSVRDGTLMRRRLGQVRGSPSQERQAQLRRRTPGCKSRQGHDERRGGSPQRSSSPALCRKGKFSDVLRRHSRIFASDGRWACHPQDKRGRGRGERERKNNKLLKRKLPAPKDNWHKKVLSCIRTAICIAFCNMCQPCYGRCKTC